MLKSTIGKPVNYGRGKYKGTVKDEVQFLEPYEGSGRDYMDLVQGIQWNDGTYGVRICYYVKDHSSDKWKFSGRPFSTSKEMVAGLLKKAQEEKWFPKIC